MLFLGVGVKPSHAFFLDKKGSDFTGELTLPLGVTLYRFDADLRVFVLLAFTSNVYFSAFKMFFKFGKESSLSLLT